MFLLNWAIPGKIQTECIEDILFWKRPLEFLDLSLYPWKFQTKWRFTPGNSTKSCYTHWNFQGQKPRPMEIPHYFFLDHAWKFHFFFYWPLEFPHFPHSIFSMPVEILCPPNATHCKRRVANSLVGCSITDWSTWYLHQEFGVTGQYWYRSLSVSLLGRHDHVKIHCTEAFCISFSLTIFDFE